MPCGHLETSILTNRARNDFSSLQHPWRGCNTMPEARLKAMFTRKNKPNDVTCDKCGKPMALKKGRFGTFFACTGYPECNTTKQIDGTQKIPK